MVTSIEGIVAVVVSADGFARIWVSPVQPANSFPGAGGLAVTVTAAPRSYGPLPLPSLTVRVGAPAALVCVRALAPLDELPGMASFAPGTGEVSKTESEEATRFTKGFCN